MGASYLTTKPEPPRRERAIATIAWLLDVLLTNMSPENGTK